MLSLRLRGFVLAVAAVAVLAVALGYAAAAFSPSAMLPGGDWRFRRSPGPVVALTFDDGPDGQYTLPIARMLHSRGVGATFFFIGKHIAEHREVARQVGELGFELGNHSYDHPDMAQMSQAQIEWQLDETNRLLAEVGGGRAAFFRPPYGSFDARVLAAARARGMAAVLWSVDSRDWADTDAASIASRVLSLARPGAVILLHSTHPQTLAALPAILDGLAAKGYRVESVSGWLAAMQEPPVPPPPPRPRIEEGPIPPPPGNASPETPAVAVVERAAKPAEAEGAAPKYRVISNIHGLAELCEGFAGAPLIPRPEAAPATRLSQIAWQKDLLAKSPELYDKEFLFNNRVYAADYYPQPRFFLLLSWEQMADVDAPLLARLAHEGGMSYTLIVSGEPSRRLVGDFGLPARVIGPGDYDAGAVFTLGRDTLSDLVNLLRRKKAAIFISLELPDDDAEPVRDFLAALIEFLTFRQLTNDRVFDPGRDLRESLQLPEGVELARFSGAGRTMLMLLTERDASMSVPRKLRGFSRITLEPDSVAEAQAIERTLWLAQGATYLLSP